MSDLIAVTTACPSLEEAERIAAVLLAAHMVAGVQIDQVRSRYHWAGEIHGRDEWRVRAWSRRSLGSLLRAKIREVHSYEVFEFVMSPLEPGTGPFADWVRETVPAHAV
jgi:periplasmic divalent cation tolerance protein